MMFQPGILKPFKIRYKIYGSQTIPLLQMVEKESIYVNVITPLPGNPEVLQASISRSIKTL